MLIFVANNRREMAVKSLKGYPCSPLELEGAPLSSYNGCNCKKLFPFFKIA